MLTTVNAALGALFAICFFGSDIAGDGFITGRIFPFVSTILFLYFLVYFILWFFERRLFPDTVRPSDYLEGKVPSLAEMDDEDYPEQAERPAEEEDPYRN